MRFIAEDMLRQGEGDNVLVRLRREPAAGEKYNNSHSSATLDLLTLRRS